MVDNMSRGDPGRPPQALSPSRIQQAQEVPGAYLSLDSGSNGNANSPRSPRSAEDDYDYQMNNMSLLKAQLKVLFFIKMFLFEKDSGEPHIKFRLIFSSHQRTIFEIASV